MLDKTASHIRKDDIFPLQRSPKTSGDLVKIQMVTGIHGSEALVRIKWLILCLPS